MLIDSFSGIQTNPDPDEVGSRRSRNIRIGPATDWIETRPGSEVITRATRPGADALVGQRSKVYAIEHDRCTSIIICVATPVNSGTRGTAEGLFEAPIAVGNASIHGGDNQNGAPDGIILAEQSSPLGDEKVNTLSVTNTDFAATILRINAKDIVHQRIARDATGKDWLIQMPVYDSYLPGGNVAAYDPHPITVQMANSADSSIKTVGTFDVNREPYEYFGFSFWAVGDINESTPGCYIIVRYLEYVGGANPLEDRAFHLYKATSSGVTFVATIPDLTYYDDDGYVCGIAWTLQSKLAVLFVHREGVSGTTLTYRVAVVEPATGATVSGFPEEIETAQSPFRIPRHDLVLGPDGYHYTVMCIDGAADADWRVYKFKLTSSGLDVAPAEVMALGITTGTDRRVALAVDESGNIIASHAVATYYFRASDTTRITLQNASGGAITDATVWFAEDSGGTRYVYCAASKTDGSDVRPAIFKFNTSGTLVDTEEFYAGQTMTRTFGFYNSHKTGGSDPQGYYMESVLLPQL